MKQSTDKLDVVPSSVVPHCSLQASVRQLLHPNRQEDRPGSKPAAANADQEPHILPQPGFAVSIYRRAVQLPACWDSLCAENQVFLKRQYLQLFEENPPNHLSFAYIVFLQHGNPVGVAACQLVDFNLARNVQHLLRIDQSLPLWRQAGQRLQRWFARRTNFRLLICGAAQATGQHAYHFASQDIGTAQQTAVLQEGLETLSRELHRQGWRPQAVLVKDFHGNDHLTPMEQADYHLFPFLPNLILHLRPEWKQFDDYLEAMVSKYRVRARRAFKKAQAIEVRSMSLQEIVANQSRMYTLYASVAESADFSMLKVEPRYFAALKEEMREDFTVLGYYKDGKLIGFCTALHNGSELEAHFLGFDTEHNHKHQLYLNMLYDIVRLGIEQYPSQAIVFSRTATEIKTSIGAEPVQMQAFMRYRCGLTNRLLPFLISRFETEEEYQQRHPFGKSE